MNPSFDTPEMLEAFSKIESGDYAAAVKLLIPLAAEGNPRAQCNLADLYAMGLGVEMDGAKAVELYRQVAEQNIDEQFLSALAYNSLAGLYLVGHPGFAPDPVKAKECRRLSKKLGFPM